jgi:hypothetical protein
MYFLRLVHQRASSSRRYLTPLPPSNVAFSALNLSLGLVANGGAANLGGLAGKTTGAGRASACSLFARWAESLGRRHE